MRHMICLLGLIVVLLTACSQEEPTLSRPDKGGKIPNTQLTGVVPSELAQVFSDAEIPLSVWNELHEVIQKRVADGDDEFINFSAAVAKKDSGTTQKYRKKTRTQEGSCPLFREHLTRYLASAMREHPITVCSTNSTSDPDKFMSLLESSDLEIYWPYSEDWDPSKEITITYWNAPSELQEKFGANTQIASQYPVAKVGYSTEVDDAAFSSGNTIVVRNRSELFATDLHLMRPTFTSDGTEGGGNNGYQSWSSEYDKDKYDPRLEPEENPDDYTYEWVFSKMMVTHQFDPRGAGGSEFEFSIVRPNDVGDAAFYTKVVVKFTRKEIDRHSIKTFEQRFNTNWTPDQSENGLILIEDDGGANNPLQFTISYKGISLIIGIPMGNANDMVCQQHYNRDFIITHRKERHCLYGSTNPQENGNVFVKMPLIKLPK